MEFGLPSTTSNLQHGAAFSLPFLWLPCDRKFRDRRQPLFLSPSCLQMSLRFLGNCRPQLSCQGTHHHSWLTFLLAGNSNELIATSTVSKVSFQPPPALLHFLLVLFPWGDKDLRLACRPLADVRLRYEQALMGIHCSIPRWHDGSSCKRQPFWSHAGAHL
jgi:hypothetical protein